MMRREHFERLLDQSGDRAYRFALGLCGNEPDARELVQDAFIRVLDRAELFDDGSDSAESWLLTILKRLYLDRQRSWSRKNGVSLDQVVGDDGATIADALADPGEPTLIERLERDECAEAVRRAIEEMPEDQRRIMTLVDVEGMGYDEAAGLLGWPLGTVRSRLSRARSHLRERLAGWEALR